MNDLDALTRGLRALEDKWELRQLVDRYAVAVDSQDVDRIMELFTDAPAVSRGLAHHLGYDEVRASFDGLGERNRFSLHSNHSQIIDELGDHDATARVFGHAEVQIGPVTMTVAYRYSDTYRRTSRGWRIHSRRIDLMYALPRESPALDDELRVRWPGAEPARADFP